MGHPYTRGRPEGFRVGWPPNQPFHNRKFIMEIVHVYQKPLKEFGRPPRFITSDMTTLIDFHPNPSIRKDFVRRDPCSEGIQSCPTLSSHSTNTERKKTKDRGMNHLEGGWPKDVNIEDPESKKRYLRKMEGEERYGYAIRRLGKSMEEYLRQNNVLDIYQTYFDEDEESYDTFCETPGAKIVTVLKDPLSTPFMTRTLSHLSWLPTGGTKLAAAFCVLDFNRVHGNYNVPLESFVWNIGNTNSPEHTLHPPGSPLVCLEFNPKDSSSIAGGCYNGRVVVFDLKSKPGSGPSLSSSIHDTHKEPVFDLRWIQSKNSTQFMTTSIDGNIFVWDTKKLSDPIDSLTSRTMGFLETTKLEKTDGKVRYFDGVLGGASLHYDLNYSATKFMVGTEQGYVLTGTRRKSKPIFIDKVYQAHVGPVYAVDRNPFIDKYFLTVGDWSVKIWNEELLTEPIITTRYDSAYLTDGCWSPTRPSVFFTTKMDGYLDIWSLIYHQNVPLYSLQVSSVGLQCIRAYTGQVIACGSVDGTASVVRLNDALSGFRGGLKQNMKEERDMLRTVLDRETQRENILQQNRKQIKHTGAKKRKNKSIKVVMGDFDESLSNIVPKKVGEEEEEEEGEDVVEEEKKEEKHEEIEREEKVEEKEDKVEEEVEKVEKEEEVEEEEEKVEEKEEIPFVNEQEIHLTSVASDKNVRTSDGIDVEGIGGTGLKATWKVHTREGGSQVLFENVKFPGKYLKIASNGVFSCKGTGGSACNFQYISHGNDVFSFQSVKFADHYIGILPDGTPKDAAQTKTGKHGQFRLTIKKTEEEEEDIEMVEEFEEEDGGEGEVEGGDMVEEFEEDPEGEGEV